MRVLAICLVFIFSGVAALADEACSQPYFSADEFRDMEQDQQVAELERLRSGLQQGCSLALEGLTYLNVSIPDDEGELLAWYRLLVEVSEILTRQTEVQKDLIEQFLTKIETQGDQLESETKSRLILEEDNATLQAERDKAVAEADQLRVALAAVKEEIRVSSIRLVAVSTREARLRQERDLIALKLNDAEKRIAELEEDVVNLHRDVIAAHDKVKERDDTIAERDATIKELEQRIETLNADLDAKDAEIAEHLATITELESRIVGQAGVITKLNDEIDKLNRMVDSRDKKIKALEATIVEKDAEIAELNKTIKKMQIEIDDLTEENRDLAEQLEEALARIAELEVENAGLKLKIEILEEKLSDAHATIAKLRDRINELEQINEKTLAALETLKKQHEKILKKQELIHDDVIALKKESRDFYRRIKEIVKDLEGVIVLGDRIVLEADVFFESGSADVSATGRANLRPIAAEFESLEKRMKLKRPWFLQINGHADIHPIRKGSKFRDNWQLSTERALSVLAVLLEYDVAAHRLAAAGYGKYQPANPGTSVSDLAKNRRIELIVTN